MDIIELERWKPSKDDPRKLEYAGQPIAQEVFEELEYRLEGMGCLPDEYFLMGDEWKDGREIPKGSDIICKVDYGESEGIYLDIGLTWYDKDQQRYVIKDFITGKTLGENGNDLDRMFLTASAVTKAFHGDHATHARYMKIGGFSGFPSKPSEAGSMGKGGAREWAQFSPKAETELSGLCDDADTGGAAVPLSQQEQRAVIEALVERREEAMPQTEQLLRRMTGSITAYMDTVGQRPLRMSDYDKAVLAIRDGELGLFKEFYPQVLSNHANDLLVETAGRPGDVGGRMMALVLSNDVRFSEEVYRTACQKAIDIADGDRARLLLTAADHYVEDLSPSFYGEMASYAYLEHRHIAKDIIKQCSDEQIAAAPPCLLEQFAADADFYTMRDLVEKGISGGPHAWRTMHMLTCDKQNAWIAERLLEKRMWVDLNDYSALQACVDNNAVGVAKLLLDGGMDFECYLQMYPDSGSEETIRALEEHWNGLQTQEQGYEQDDAPEVGGMTFG